MYTYIIRVSARNLRLRVVRARKKMDEIFCMNLGSNFTKARARGILAWRARAEKNYVQYYTQKWPGGNPEDTRIVINAHLSKHSNQTH